MIEFGILFFPQNPGFASHLTFRVTLAPELSFDCSHYEPEYVSCSATRLFAFLLVLLSFFTLENFRFEPTMRAVRQFI